MDVGGTVRIKEEKMATNLFVSGLPYVMTDSELRGLFEEVGTVVSASVITERESGRSRGFGFVEMASEEEARRAIEQLNRRVVDGQTLTVNEARPRETRAGGRERGGGYGRGAPTGGRRRR